MPSPYEILGIPPGASKREISRAYRRLAKRCHPDVVSPTARASAHEQFIRVRAAHDELMDSTDAATRPAPTATTVPSARRPAERERPWETLADRRLSERVEAAKGRPPLVLIVALACIAALAVGFVGARWAAAGRQPVGARLASPSDQEPTPTESSPAGPNLLRDAWREGVKGLPSLTGKSPQAAPLNGAASR